MRNLNQHTITQAVLERIANTPNPRTKEIITSLVTHLHDFARDVKLTEEEWMQGIQFLTKTGQMCDAKRQEFILLSDVLGLSMLTIALNHDKPSGCTEPTVFGPFFLEEAPHYELGADVANGAKGAPCLVSGRILSLTGEVIPNATINVWQADEDGLYDVQYVNPDRIQARGILKSDANGHYHFKTIVAEAYPIPTDGPTGDFLKATSRHPWRPAHLHFMVEAPGYERLITHVFRSDDEYLDSDAVFGVRQTLIADWPEQPDGSFTMNYDFVLNPMPTKASKA
jgi:hydroxyquinol 1,2-dioxygenase